MENKAVWFPNEKELTNYRLYNWMQKLGYNDYDSFYKKSIDDVSWFWDEVMKELNISWYEPYQQVLQFEQDWKMPKWFVDGKINVVENALNKWANNTATQFHTAIISEGENGDVVRYSFLQLQTEVNKAASGFLKIGMQKGDIVTIYMPMIAETVISILALAKIGCIYSPVFSGYRADAIASRMNASQSTYLITADSFFRRGKKIPMKTEADTAANMTPTLRKIIVVNRTNEKCPWDEKRDVDWTQLLSTGESVETEQMNSNDPFMLIYTSGTTGKPKGTVHTHSGFPIKAAFDAGICMDVKQGDTLFWYTDMGWMMGPFLIFGGLLNGATILLFEGVPDYPNNNRIWQLSSKHNVTHLGISPTLIRSLMNKDDTNPHQFDLSSLRLIGSTGEPWNQDPWMWLFEKVGNKKIPIFNYSGGTEISGGILGNILLKPIAPVTFNSPIPGMKADVFNSLGQSVTDEVGELVITKPWVGMTKGFWLENDRYEEAYWQIFNQTWVHGDLVIKDSDGFWTITGRADDILNIAGKRVGPAEIESAIVHHHDVIEAACIGIPHPIKGESAVCFVVMKNSPSSMLPNDLIQLVAISLGKALKPDLVHFIPALPKTRNGKIMRRIIKAAYLNQPLGDVSSLENIEVLDIIKQLKI